MADGPDFSGWATRYNIECSDGLTLRDGAFAHNDGSRVPLVWQHDHNNPENVLGYAELENRPEGVYAKGYFNDNEMGQTAKKMVQHGDITSLSIYANKLTKQGQDVLHGQIRELSLVLSGANPEAFIDKVSVAHGSDGVDVMDAVIYSGSYLEHADAPSNKEGSSMAERTIQDVIDGMSEEQQQVLYYLVGQAVEEDAPADEADKTDSKVAEKESDSKTTENKTDDSKELVKHQDSSDDEEDFEVLDKDKFAVLEDEDNSFGHSDNEGNSMTGNVFANGASTASPVISHSEIEDIVKTARKNGSLADAFLAHADQYGIDNIDLLFPDAKSLTGPEFLKRQDEWVTKVLQGVHKSPFARVKSVLADITADEARARGYIKGNQKKDEIIKLMKRETLPTTIYKKQKLDRDDVIDITDLDVVAWLKGEMKLMLNEEIARAILFGDGREIDNESKIKEENIRPVAKDFYPYTNTVTSVKADGYVDLTKNIIRARKNYRGSGIPTLYTSTDVVTELLLLEDKMGRPLYDDIEKLKTKLRVADIVEIPDAIFAHLGDTFGVIVNLNDYTIGSDKGGETTMFEDFDIDFNQQKYLIETRLSGALTKPEAAIILKWGSSVSVAQGTANVDENGVVSAPVESTPAGE